MRTPLTLAFVSLAGLAAAFAAPAQAADWQMGTGATACSARLAGPQVDLVMMINGRSHLILMAGNPKWMQFDDKPVESSFQLDAAAPVHLKGQFVGPFFMAELDEPLGSAFTKAAAMTWEIPKGRYTVKLQNAAATVAALRACSDNGAKTAYKE